MPRALIRDRFYRNHPAAAAGLALTLALQPGVGRAAVAAAPRLDLVDACLDPGSGRIELPLVLSGADELRPSSLRTVIAFDPGELVPEPEILPGLMLGAAGARLSTVVDAGSGQVELRFHMDGTLPVRPLPAGELARLRLHRRPGEARPAEPGIALLPGESRALDGNGRPTFVEVGPPARPAPPGAGPWLWLFEEGRSTFVAAEQAPMVRDPGPERLLVLRGRLDDLRPQGRQVSMGPLHPLAMTEVDGLYADGARPEAGRVFVYVVAAPDADGRISLGFDSACRPRRPAGERAAGR